MPAAGIRAAEPSAPPGPSRDWPCLPWLGGQILAIQAAETARRGMRPPPEVGIRKRPLAAASPAPVSCTPLPLFSGLPPCGCVFRTGPVSAVQSTFRLTKPHCTDKSIRKPRYKNRFRMITEQLTEAGESTGWELISSAIFFLLPENNREPALNQSVRGWGGR